MFKNTKELKEVLNSIKDDLSDSRKVEAVELASRIIDDWSFYLKFVGEKNAIEDAVDSIYDNGNIDYNRLAELAKADKEHRCVIYKHGFPVASQYYQEGGLYIRETSGVIDYEEYLKVMGENNGKQN